MAIKSFDDLKIKTNITSNDLKKIHELEYKIFKLESLDSAKHSTLNTIKKYKSELSDLLRNAMLAMKDVYAWYISYHSELYDPNDILNEAKTQYSEINPSRLDAAFDRYLSGIPTRFHDIFTKCEVIARRKMWSAPPFDGIYNMFLQLKNGPSGNDMVLFQKALTTVHQGGPMVNHFADRTGISRQMLDDLNEGKFVDGWDKEIEKFAFSENALSKRARLLTEEEARERAKLFDEVKNNPIIEEEKYSKTKDVELWHGVKDEAALQKLPNGNFLLTPNPKSDTQKLWFVPAWSYSGKETAIGYANYALVKITIPFEFNYTKVTKKNGEVQDRQESYKPIDPKWKRTEQVQEWFLHDGVMEIEPNQVILADEALEAFVSIHGSAKKKLSKRANDPLSAYKKKRDFDETTEPEGKVEKTNKHRFVIQDHKATKHHWDFRIENDDGAMTSFALPKHRLPIEKDRLLAVETEQHPLEYRNFEGAISAGEYGSGKVSIYDSGPYELIEWKKDTIKIKLNGKKEKDSYTLHRTNGKNWIIMRSKE